MAARLVRSRLSRDPGIIEAAESAEQYAEETQSDDAFLVAHDAWLEAGDPERAWFMLLATKRHWLERPGPPFVLPADRVAVAQIAARLEQWEATRDDLRVRGPMTDEIIDRIDERAGTSRPTNAELSRLEVWRFLRFQPREAFGYVDRGGVIRTFANDLLATIVTRGATVRPYGRGARIQHVSVAAINGYYYSGTCAVENGNYCKLRRRRPWLRPPR